MPGRQRRRWRILAFDTLPSTNDEARRLAERGARAGVAVLARAQTEGRGRHGRSWASPPGGLYLSAVLRPRLEAARAGLVPLAAGLAMAEVVEGLGLRPELRWPNDLLLGGRKAGGVLCEARLRPGGGRPGAGRFARARARRSKNEQPWFVDWVVAGMGLNVAQEPAAIAGTGGVTLAEALGKRLEPAPLAEPLLERLGRAVQRAEHAPPELVEAWSRRAAFLGRAVSLETREGAIAGLAEGVDPTGALLVATPEGPRRVVEADVLRVVEAGAAT